MANKLKIEFLLFEPIERYEDIKIIDGEEEGEYQFITTVKKAKQCLDTTEHYISKLKEMFQILKDDLSNEFEFIYEGENDFNVYMNQYDYESWSSAVKRIAVKLSKDGEPDPYDNSYLANYPKTNVPYE